MLQVGLIIGSTRPNRFADIPARWVRAGWSTAASAAMKASIVAIRRLIVSASARSDTRLMAGWAVLVLAAEA